MNRRARRRARVAPSISLQGVQKESGRLDETGWNAQRRIARVVALLAACTILAYVPSIHGAFLFDDHSFILRNAHVLDADFAAIFSHSTTAGAGVESNFFRPLQQSLFAVTATLFGTASSMPFHLLSLAAHLVGGLLCLLWMRRMHFTPAVAMVALGVFWLHPVQTQAISYASGLGDPLAHAWMWAAMLAFERVSRPGPTTHGNRWPEACAVLLCMLLALTSKESAVVLAPWLLCALLYRAHLHGRPPTAAAWTLAGAIALAGVWTVLKLTVWNFTGRFGLTPEHSVYAQDLGLRLTTFLGVIAEYARLLVVPWPLHYEKAVAHYDGVLHLRGLFGLGLLALVGCVLLRFRRWPGLALACGLACSAMLPYTGVIPLNAAYLEHWLYMAMPGIGLALGLCVARLSRFGLSAAESVPRTRRLPLAALGAACVLAAATITGLRAAQWADPVTFYRHELQHGPRNHRVLTNLAMALAERQAWGEAERLFREAIAAAPSHRFADGHYNLALLLVRTGRNTEATLELQRALRIDPQHPGAQGLQQRLGSATGR